MVQLDKFMEVWNTGRDLTKLLGMRITRLDQGYAVGEMDITEDFLNINGSVHGGTIFSLADSVSGAAATAYGYRVATISADIQYLSPGLGCKKLICEAKEIKHGKKISFYDLLVSDETGKLLTKGTFTYCNLGIPIPELQDTEA